MAEINLRPYQMAAVERIRDGIRSGNRKQVLMSPTGSGKTEISCYLLQECMRKKSRALFIVDRVVLVDQTSERMDSYGIPHGVLQSGHWRKRLYEPIQVCSAQTIERRGIPDDISVVFVDECHSLRKWVTDFISRTGAVVVGLTATPFAKGMGNIYSNLINIATTNDLIAQGFLVPLKIYAAKSINVTGMKVIAGEWSEKEIEERGLDIIGDIVSEWQDKTQKYFGGPAKTIVFSATVDHGAELCAQFNAAGFRFEQISYRDSSDERRRSLIDEFRKPDSKIHGLVSCEVFTRGFDVPDVRIGISARPYRKSLSSHIQQMGRIMRLSLGKEFGLWLDHSGNVFRFARDVADIFEHGLDELDDGKREELAKKEPTEKEKKELKCAVCGYVMLTFCETCPGCGKERKRRLSAVEALPGTMVEIEGKAANKKYSWDQKIEFMSALKGYAAQKGFQPGFVAHKYHEKFGVWPNDPRVREAPIGAVSPNILNWIRSQQIRYAKSKKHKIA